MSEGEGKKTVVVDLAAAMMDGLEFLGGLRLYRLEGKKPVVCKDFLEFAMAFEQDERTVALTKLGETEVQTSFIGIDMSAAATLGRENEGAPVVFESLVRSRSGGSIAERYATWEAAEAGHRRVVARLERGEKEESEG